jgi:hypothetical protein
MISFLLFFSLLARIPPQPAQSEYLASDPLDHPDILAMDLRRLADLPLPERSHASVAEPRDALQGGALARCA